MFCGWKWMIIFGVLSACKSTEDQNLNSQLKSSEQQSSFKSARDSYNQQTGKQSLKTLGKDWELVFEKEYFSWEVVQEELGLRVEAKIKVSDGLIELIIKPEENEMDVWILPTSKTPATILEMGDYLRYDLRDKVEEKTKIVLNAVTTSSPTPDASLVYVVRGINIKADNTAEAFSMYMDLIFKKYPLVSGNNASFPNDWQLIPTIESSFVPRFHLVADVKLEEDKTVLAFVQVSHPKSQFAKNDSGSDSFFYDLQFHIRPLNVWNAAITFICKVKWNQRYDQKVQKYVDYYSYSRCDDERYTPYTIIPREFYSFDAGVKSIGIPGARPFTKIYRSQKFDKDQAFKQAHSSTVLKEINEKYDIGKQVSFLVSRPVGLAEACLEALAKKHPETKVIRSKIFAGIEKSAVVVEWKVDAEANIAKLTDDLTALEASNTFGKRKCFKKVKHLGTHFALLDWKP